MDSEAPVTCFLLRGAGSTGPLSPIYMVACLVPTTCFFVGIAVSSLYTAVDVDDIIFPADC